MKNKLFPCVDYIPNEDLEAAGIKIKADSFVQRMNEKQNVKAIKTGEFRCPKKGEWYLSGAVVEAYRAANDLTIPYHIAKLVMTETKTIIVTKIIK